MHEQIARLIKCIDLEEKEQMHRFRLDQQHSLKMLKAEGLALHPLIITRKTFGYAEYPEISFKLPYPSETGFFRDGAAIEFFIEGEEPVKGILLSLDGTSGEFRLFAPDFPEWVEDKGTGIKLAPDTRTTGIMKKVMLQIEQDKFLFAFFQQLHESNNNSLKEVSRKNETHFAGSELNESQEEAVQAMIENGQLCIIHGPPGTGKTTTLAEGISRLVRTGKKVIVAAPSNTATDHLSAVLIAKGIKLLRVGNSSKVAAEVFPHTPEGKLQNSKAAREIKDLRKRAEEFRRMALKYKRSFGKEEREQRDLLFKEVKSIRAEIKRQQVYNEEKLFAEADVIAGTPIGLYDTELKKYSFDTLVIDEAGQCIEPLGWCIFPLAERIVLAGDHLQLPPTVLSVEAEKLGFNKSILETAIEHTGNAYLLKIQYRMRALIAGFSSNYFYNGQLLHAPALQNTGEHLVFIDTAGSGYEEKQGPDGVSLQNEGELATISKYLEATGWNPADIAFISPYAGQVILAASYLPDNIRKSTVDSFQGQENKHILLSLVRSNDEGNIGFLKDYRRMNVAMTRAKETLVVIGDSATIGSDPFYKAFLNYVEKHAVYRSVWEFIE